MTNYNLEEFKTWIIAQNSQILKKKISEGTFNSQYLPDFYTYYQSHPERWEKVILGQDSGTLRQEIVKEWIKEVDQREREREQQIKYNYANL